MNFPWLQTQTFNILLLKSYRIFTCNVKKNSLQGYHNFFHMDEWWMIVIWIKHNESKRWKQVDPDLQV